MKRALISETKLGKILFVEDGDGITNLALITEQEIVALGEKYEFLDTDLLKEAEKQLEEYLEGNLREFTVSLQPQGTEFQQRVWMALRQIPYGETSSYKQIAELVGNTKASRAVGMANNRNPIMCMIPCHRVIGANGSLVGYAGGLDRKKQLLELEQGKDERYE